MTAQQFPMVWLQLALMYWSKVNCLVPPGNSGMHSGTVYLLCVNMFNGSLTQTVEFFYSRVRLMFWEKERATGDKMQTLVY